MIVQYRRDMNIHPAPLFDRELVSRYDINAPRYTSYPTAPHFRDNFHEADLVRAIRIEQRAYPLASVCLYAHSLLSFAVLLLRLRAHHHA